MCFCLKTSNSIRIVDSLILNSWSRALRLVLNKAYPTHILCPWGHIIAYLSLGTWDRHFATMIAAILNSENNNKMHKNCDNAALTRAQKGHLFTVRNLKQESRASIFCLSWDPVYLATQFFFAVSIDLLQINFIEWEIHKYKICR